MIRSIVHWNSFTLLVSVALFYGCNGSGSDHSKAPEYAECDKLINTSENISDYVPENIRSDATLNDYVHDAFESFVKVGDKMSAFLDNAAEFKNDSFTIAKIDNHNALSVAKGSMKVFKTITKGAIKAGGLLLTASDFAFSYKSDFEEYKRTYSKSKIDSLRHVMHYISIYNIMQDNYMKQEMKRINEFKSIRSTALIPGDIIDQSGLMDNLKLHKELIIESNKVVRILLLNKMRGYECTDLGGAIDEMANSFQANDETVKYNLDILEDYCDLLNKLKSGLSKTKLYIEKNQSNYSSEIIDELNKVVEEYEEQTTANISRLNIYESISPAENEIRKAIKKGGSDIYFE